MALPSKIKDILTRAGPLAERIGHWLSFLKPTLVVFSIASVIFFCVIVALVVTMPMSECEFPVGSDVGICTHTTITGLPFWLMVALSALAGYLLAAVGIFLCARCFDHSQIKGI